VGGSEGIGYAFGLTSGGKHRTLRAFRVEVEGVVFATARESLLRILKDPENQAKTLDSAARFCYTVVVPSNGV
jgi:hypothetical protein